MALDRKAYTQICLGRGSEHNYFMDTKLLKVRSEDAIELFSDQVSFYSENSLTGEYKNRLVDITSDGITSRYLRGILTSPNDNSNDIVQMQGGSLQTYNSGGYKLSGEYYNDDKYSCHVCWSPLNKNQLLITGSWTWNANDTTKRWKAGQFYVPISEIPDLKAIINPSFPYITSGQVGHRQSVTSKETETAPFKWRAYPSYKYQENKAADSDNIYFEVKCDELYLWKDSTKTYVTNAQLTQVSLSDKLFTDLGSITISFVTIAQYLESTAYAPCSVTVADGSADSSKYYFQISIRENSSPSSSVISGTATETKLAPLYHQYNMSDIQSWANSGYWLHYQLIPKSSSTNSNSYYTKTWTDGNGDKTSSTKNNQTGIALSLETLWATFNSESQSKESTFFNKFKFSCEVETAG